MNGEILTDISDAEWRAFLAECTEANIFQSPQLRRVYEKTDGYRPRLVGQESGGRLRALMASVDVSLSPRPLASLTALTTRTIVTGGPLGDSAFFASLLASHDSQASRISLLTQVRNLIPRDPHPFKVAGYSWEDHLNFVLDLTRGEDVLLEGMSKTRRKGIAYGDRKGFGVRELGVTDLRESYVLLHSTYSRVAIPLAPKSLFETALRELAPGNLIALGAVLNGELVAVRFVLRWGSDLYDWYSGSSPEADPHADEWLVWQVLREGIARGCTRFDFGGAGSPKTKYGPREFKRRFGGSEINPGRFEKVYRPLSLRAAKAAYSFWRRLT